MGIAYLVMFLLAWCLGMWVVGRSQYRMGLCDGYKAAKHANDTLYDAQRKIIRSYEQ